MSGRRRSRVPVVLVLFVAAACRTPDALQRPPIVQPGAPGEASKAISAAEAVNQVHPQHTPADVEFMQGMIGHHAQALDMTELLATRTKNEEMRKLAQRIEVSQADEIRFMQRWLEVRGQAVPDRHAHHAHDAKLMPGMLTPGQMARLAATSGPEFDRLFLELMTGHHMGALVMVEQLFATPGAGQEAEIFAFASDVDSDQRMEIARMGAMLNGLKERHK